MTSPPTSHVRWFLVFLLFVLSAVAFLDRVNLSIAGAKISEEFAISNVRLGFVFSAFLFGYALFQTPAGWLADRFGPRRMLALGVLWWGVFTALTAAISHSLGNTVLVLVVIRFLLGAGEAIVYPASNQFVARWIPSQERGVANAIIFAGVGIGAGITPPLISFLMLRYGWRSSFWISALIGLAIGAVWFLAARDTPDEHPSLSSNELTLIQQGIPKSAASKEGNLLTWSSILSSRNVWVLAGGAGSLYLSQSSFWAVSADLGGKSSGSLSGLMNMANQIGGMITVSLTPFLADRFGWNTGFYVAAAIAGLGAIAWLFVDPGLTLSLGREIR